MGGTQKRDQEFLLHEALSTQKEAVRADPQAGPVHTWVSVAHTKCSHSNILLGRPDLSFVLKRSGLARLERESPGEPVTQKGPGSSSSLHWGLTPAPQATLSFRDPWGLQAQSPKEGRLLGRRQTVLHPSPGEGALTSQTSQVATRHRGEARGSLCLPCQVPANLVIH